MPIYEYSCRRCGAAFELLVRNKRTPKCSSCGSEELDRQFSLPAVQSETTRANAMKSAKNRDKKTAIDRVEAQRLYEKNHD